MLGMKGGEIRCDHPLGTREPIERRVSPLRQGRCDPSVETAPRPHPSPGLIDSEWWKCSAMRDARGMGQERGERASWIQEYGEGCTRMRLAQQPRKPESIAPRTSHPLRLGSSESIARCYRTRNKIEKKRKTFTENFLRIT